MKKHTPTIMPLIIRKCSLAFLVILLTGFASYAQEYKMFNGNIYTCSGQITDSGGSSGNYGKNEKFTTTICSDNPQYSLLQIAFKTSDLKPGDELCIYDGINTNFPLLSCSAQTGNFPYVIQSTKNNPAGCLTLVFTSDNFLQGSGFIGEISCKPVCQDVVASITSANNPNGGNAVIDLCAGEAIELKAVAAFPQNNQNYFQKAGACKYEWYLDNHLAATTETYNVPVFTEGGHSVNLLITDTLGCKSQNLALQKLRVAPKPTFFENNFEKLICVNDQLDISTAINLDKSKDLTLNENWAFFPQQDYVIDSVALPDGTGQAFSSVLFIGKFNPTEIIDDPDDLDQVCITVEHSFLSDIEITLTCPSGQKIILQEQGKKTGVVHLGEPVEDDELLPDPIPGLGYLYCWQMGAPNGTWNDYVLKNSPKTLPAGVYAPYQSFENLYGCPIDGLWTISVKDLWNNDNGYLFYWSMQFNPNLYPPVDSFTNNITSGKWLPNETLLSQSAGSMSTEGIAPGAITHVWEVTDDNGCTFDYPVNLQVRPELDTKCGQCNIQLLDMADQDICASEQLVIQAETQPGGLQTKSDFSIMSSEVNTELSYKEFNIPVSLYNFPSTLNISTLINSVCLTAEGTDLSKTDLSLVSPDGKEILLYAQNDINANAITQTCFLPSSLNPVTSGSGSYTGNFKPANDFVQLTDCKVKGDWRIRVKKPVGDRFILTEANLDFNIINNLHYSWQSSSLIDCDTCQKVSIAASKNDVVTLFTFDDYGCGDSKSFKLNVLPAFAAPVVSYNVLPGGTIVFNWTAIAGASGYEVSINGQAWTTPNGALSHTLSNLPPGTVINFSVKVSSGVKACPNEIATVSASINDCGLLTVITTTPESCIGTKDGEIKLTVTNATGSLSYSLNGANPVSNGTFTNLASGAYSIIIQDGNGCKDTIQADIKTAPPITISKTVKDVSCFGLSDGSISVEAFGGSGVYTYNWIGNAATGPNATSLSAGIYTLFISDNKNCSVTDTFYVKQPTQLTSVPFIQKPSCFGFTDAYIDVQSQGGVKPYQYNWSDGSGQGIKTGLGAGTYKVTITDVNGCSVVKNILVTQPAALKDTVDVIQPSCFGDSNGSIEIKLGGGTSPYSFNWNEFPLNNSSKVNGLSSGKYSVTASDANGCKVAKTVTLVEPAKVEAIADAEDESCPGLNDAMAEIVISSGKGPFTYTWPNGVTANGNKAMNLLPGNYSVEVANAKGCKTTVNFTVNAAAPFAGFVDAPLIDCKSTSGIATVVITDGVAPYTYLWNDPLAQTTSQATSLATGNYKVSITDSRNCQLVLDANVTSNDPVLVDQISVNNTSCNNTTDGSAQLSFKGGTLPYTITWNNGIPANDFNPQNLASGTFEYIVTDNVGCTLKGDIIINAPEPAILTAQSTDAACKFGATGKIDLTVTGGTPPYAASWSNGASGLNIDKLTAGAYTVTVTDNKNCNYTQLFSISEPAEEFTIEATQKYVSCYGQKQGVAEVKMLSGSGTIATVLWNTAATVQTIKYLAPGNYSVTVTDSYSCKQSKSINVNEWQAVTFDVTTTKPTCNNTTDGKIIVTNINGGAGAGDLANYQVSWNNQVPGQNFTQKNLACGQNVTIKVIDQQGCATTKDVGVPVTQAIDYIVTEKEPTCYQSKDGVVEIKNVSGGSMPYTFKWNTGATSPLIAALPSGVYNCTITDANACQRNVSASISEPEPIMLNGNVINPVCEYDSNGSISLNPAGGNAPYKYQWANGSTTSSITGLTQGNFVLTVTDITGCSITSTFAVKAQNQIESEVEILAAACFEESTGAASINVTEGKAPLQYSLNGQPFSSDNYFEKLPAGKYEATIKDKDGCTDKLQFEIKSGADFTIDKIQDMSVEYGKNLEVTPNIALNGQVSYKWNTINVAKAVCDTCLRLDLTPQQDGYVWLLVTDENGCYKEVKFFIDVIKDYKVFVPTAFSPNNDGVNDYLSIFAKDGIQVAEIKVFDQWGELVYSVDKPEMNQESKGWDGSFYGRPMNTGVFVWVLKAIYPDGSEEILSGETTLIR